MSEPSIELRITLPGGIQAYAYVSEIVIAVTANGKACVAHPRWMNAAELNILTTALRATAAGMEEL